MPSQTEILKSQQRQLKTSRQRTASLQVQQQALQTGQTAGQIIAERERAEQQEQQEKKQEQLNKELQNFNSNLTYENYEQKYSKLSSEAKKNIASPSELKKSPEYKQYQSAKQAQEQAQLRNAQYNQAIRILTGQTSGGDYKKIPKDIREQAEAYVQSNPSLGNISGADSSLPSWVRERMESGAITEIAPTIIPEISSQAKVGGDDAVRQLLTKKTERQMLTEAGITLKKGALTGTERRALENIEIQRYRDLGYTSSEASKLAIESAKSGGVSFTPETAKRIIRGETYAQIERDKGIYQKGFELGDITGGVGVVSARGEDLSIPKVYEKDDRDGIIRDTSRKDLGFFGKLGAGIGDWFGDFKSHFEKEKEKEFYIEELKGFGRVSATGITGTIEFTPASPKEIEKYNELKEKGSAEYLFKKVEQKIVTPTLDFIKPITTPILNFPIKEKLESGIWWKDLSPVPISTPGETFGEKLINIKKAKTWAGETSSLGWADISQELYKKSESEKGWFKTQLTGFAEVSLMISKGVRYAPDILQYTALGGAGGAGLDLVTIEAEKLQIEKTTKKEVEKQYTLYKKEYETAKKDLEEGYELEPILTKKEFEKQYGGEIKSSIMAGLKRESVLPFLILGTSGAIKIGKGIKKLITPVDIESTLIKSKTFRLEGIEERFLIETEQGIKEYAMFKDMYVRTPTTIYRQSPIGKLLGFEPKLKILSRGQTYIYQPVANVFGIPIETKAPYLAEFGRVGKGGEIVGKKFYYVGSKTKDIIPEELLTLPKQNQYVWRNIIEATKTGGRPIRYEDLSKYFSEEELLGIGISKQIDISKIGTGRATRLTTTGSVVTPIETFESGVRTFRIETGYKDITKPFTRATGKVPIKTDIIIRYPIISKDTGTGVDVLMGGGRKSGEQFLKELYAPPKQILRPIIDIPKNVVKITTKASNVITKIMEPALGTSYGIIKKESAYAGKGIYERTKSIGRFKFLTLEKGKIDIGLRYINLQKEKQTQIEKSVLKADQRINQILQGRIKTETKTEIMQSQMQASIQQPELTQIQINTFIDTGFGSGRQPPTPKPTKIKSIKIIQIPLPSRKEQFPGRPEKEQGYFVYVKKDSTKKAKARDVKINPKPLTKKEAEDALAYALDNSIGATGYPKKTKKRPVPNQYNIPIGYAEFTRQKFRNYKIKKGKRIKLAKGRIIEKRGRRLDTAGEKMQISATRALAKRQRQNVFSFFATPNKKKVKEKINFSKILGL